MSNIFIITASNPSAKKHVQDTIENPIPPEKVEKHFGSSEIDQVREIGKSGYYAWGATPGIWNIPHWASMKVGDHVLIYQDKMYTYVTKVAFKARNRDFALANWGQGLDGNTWEYMYLLEKPIKLHTPIPASSLRDYLPSMYRGFTAIGDLPKKTILQKFG